MHLVRTRESHRYPYTAASYGPSCCPGITTSPTKVSCAWPGCVPISASCTSPAVPWSHEQPSNSWLWVAASLFHHLTHEQLLCVHLASHYILCTLHDIVHAVHTVCVYIYLYSHPYVHCHTYIILCILNAQLHPSMYTYTEQVKYRWRRIPWICFLVHLFRTRVLARSILSITSQMLPRDCWWHGTWTQESLFGWTSGLTPKSWTVAPLRPFSRHWSTSVCDSKYVHCSFTVFVCVMCVCVCVCVYMLQSIVIMYTCTYVHTYMYDIAQYIGYHVCTYVHTCTVYLIHYM